MTETAYIYRRFSTDEQGSRQGDTLAIQLEACKAFARSKGWQVGEVLTDAGKSAFTGDHLQPGTDLSNFLERVARGEIAPNSILLAYRLDRLSRRPVEEAMSWMYSIRKQGVRIALADTGVVLAEETSLGSFLETAIRQAQNHEESAKKSALISAAKRKLWDKAERREGKWTNLAARPPLWLERNDERNDWVTNEDRVRIVNEIYELSASGLGSVVIANRLNARTEKPWGIWHKGEPAWGRTAIRQLLQNPAVEGDFVPEKGMFVGKKIVGFYPRIVDADLVARARTARRSRSKAADAPVSSNGTVNLFSGRARCSACGQRASASSNFNKKTGRTYVYLRCQRAGEGRCTNSAYYAYTPFENTALDLCVDLALDNRFFEASGELRDARIRQAELEKSIADKRDRRGRLLANFAADDDDQVRDLINGLKTEIDQLASELAAAEEAIQRASGNVGAVEHLRRVNDIREAAKSDDLAIREEARSKLRQALSAIVSVVFLDNKAGQNVFTLILAGGVFSVQIDMKGKVIAAITGLPGQPLWDQLPTEYQEMLAPLVKRIEATGVIAKVRSQLPERKGPSLFDEIVKERFGS